MTQPVIYYQTDARWKNISYSAKGESTTIGASGCGPTSMAMVLATWADKSVTPATECAWALKNGYKCPHSGTYYSYFVPAAKRYGLTCKQLNGASIYGNASSTYHAQAKAAIDNNDLVIACMGKGTWTSSGHYVVVWNIRGNTIYINDPASSRLIRTQGDYSTFKKQVKYYWVIKNPNKKAASPAPQTQTVAAKPKEDELDMTIDEMLAKMTPQQAYELMSKALAFMGEKVEPGWSQREGHWQRAVENGVINGGAPERLIQRDEVVAILGRLGLV